MLFKKQNCVKCNCEFDSLSRVCPQCGEINQDLRKYAVGKGVIPLAFPYQIACIVLGTFGLALFSIFFSCIAVIFNVEEPNLTPLVEFGSYITMFLGVIFLIVLNREFILKQFGQLWRYAFGICFGIALIGFSYLYGLVLEQFVPNSGVNENESIIENLVVNYPILSIIAFGILGPICEEVTFRLGIFSFSTRLNRIAAYFIACLIFALAHFSWNWITTGDMDALFIELINLPTYLVGAFILTLSYDLFGLPCSMLAHVTNNLYVIITVIIAANI